jgi:hypothetical protein
VQGFSFLLIVQHDVCIGRYHRTLSKHLRCNAQVVVGLLLMTSVVEEATTPTPLPMGEALVPGNKLLSPAGDYSMVYQVRQHSRTRAHFKRDACCTAPIARLAASAVTLCAYDYALGRQQA